MVICLCSIYQKTSFLNMKKYLSIRMYILNNLVFCDNSIVTKKLLIYQSTKITVLYFKLPYVQLQKVEIMAIQLITHYRKMHIKHSKIVLAVSLQYIFFSLGFLFELGITSIRVYVFVTAHSIFILLHLIRWDTQSGLQSLCSIWHKNIWN